MRLKKFSVSKLVTGWKTWPKCSFYFFKFFSEQQTCQIWVCHNLCSGIWNFIFGWARYKTEHRVKEVGCPKCFNVSIIGLSSTCNYVDMSSEKKPCRCWHKKYFMKCVVMFIAIKWYSKYLRNIKIMSNFSRDTTIVTICQQAFILQLQWVLFFRVCSIFRLFFCDLNINESIIVSIISSGSRHGTLRGMVKNLPLLRRVGSSGRPWVHAIMCDNTYSDKCMIINGESCFNLVKSANRYWLHMIVRCTTTAYHETMATKGLFITCPSANIIGIKGKRILRVNDSGI